MADLEQIVALAQAGGLSESLQVEFKVQIDTSTDPGVAKLAKALLALRNRNGGHLLIGLRNDGQVAQAADCPPALLDGLTIDFVQQQVGTYSSHQFECIVRQVALSDGRRFVCVAVPGGTKVPAVCKSDLRINGSAALTTGDVYFRSLDANNTPSTSKIIWKSWPDLIAICLENHESEIAGFIRRNFGEDAIEKFCETVCSGPPDKGQLVVQSPSPTAPPSPVTPPAALVPSAPLAPTPSITAVLTQQMADLTARYEAGLRERNTQPEQFGWLRTLVAVDPPIQGEALNERFIEKVFAANPQLTGWPAWLDSRNFRETSSRPVVRDGGWEAYLSHVTDEAVFTDYQRWEATGRIFLARALQDDIPESERSPEPRTLLDFSLMILRIAERLEVARRIYLGLGALPASKASFIFQINKLGGRMLTSWSNPGRYISPGRVAVQDVATAFCELSLDAGQQLIVDKTHYVANEIFHLFGGFEISRKVTADLVENLLQRRW